MATYSQLINTKELYDVLKYFFEDTYSLDNIFKQQCKKLLPKLLSQTKKKFVKNHSIIFGIKDSSTEFDKIRKQNILGIKNLKVAYIYYLCLQEIVSEENENLIVLKTKYSKELFEYEEFFDTIACLFMYTDSPTSKGISIDKIDDILSNKKIAKHVRQNKSVATILTGRKDDKYFRAHQKTKTEIVPIEMLGKYLDIGNKHTYIECPICGYDLEINIHTINNRIIYDKKKQHVRIICNHENSDYKKEMPYKFDYMHENTKSIPMYVLNNYDYLVNKFLILPKLRKAQKKDKLLSIKEYAEYNDIGDKYIFITHPREQKKKIKVTNNNLLKIFTINDDKKKIYINNFDTPDNIYKIIAYINCDDLNDVLEAFTGHTTVAMTILNNYNLLLLKNLIKTMD
jgi:hypothetical protein